MKHIDKASLHEIDDGKMIICKPDHFIIGDGIDLGINDTIDNYEKRTFADKERIAFWKTIRIDEICNFNYTRKEAFYAD